MKRLFIIAASLAALSAPASASEWMGSFYGVPLYTDRYDGTYTSTWKNGKIKGDVTGLLLGQAFEPASLPFRGTYSVGKGGKMKGDIDFAGPFVGYRGKGEMQGVFQRGGRFDGTRTSKGKSGKKG